MDDKKFEQLRLKLAEVLRHISALQDQADELARQVNEEEERRMSHPGDVREFQPRPGGDE